MDYFRDSVRSMEGYAPGEQPRDKRYVKLNTNENPYPPSPRVLEAVREAATADLRLYPDPTATRLREIIAGLWDVSADHVLAGQGGDDLLNLIVRACAGRGDNVASLFPSYTLYQTLAALQEATFVGVERVDDLPEVGAKVNFVCNPNAPTGLWTEAPVLDGLARRLDGLLVIDEAYADFAKKTCMRLVRSHPNVIVVRSLSKSFSLAGMRLGYGVSQPHNIRELVKVKESYNLDRVSQAAGAAALSDVGYAEANCDRVIATRERLKEALGALGLSFYPSESNFVFFRVANAAEIKQALMDRGVLVRYLGLPGHEDYLRVSVGTDEEIDRFLAELKRLL
jgi:histidinol-phosphate aminotransferase